MIVDLSNIYSGFSDKLRAITFYIALNKLKKNSSNVFYIYEKKTKECPFRFIDYCRIKKIKIIKLKKKRKSLIHLSSYNTEITLKNVINNNPFESINNIILYNEWKKSYKKILPGFKIQKKINNIKLPKNFLGLHLRTTDRTLKFQNILSIQFKDAIFDFQLEYFKKNISKILKEETKIKNIYVASDSKNIKDFVVNNLKKYNYKIFANNSKYKKGFRKTSGEDFLIDFFSLQKGKVVLSTVGAGVTQSIFLMKRIEIINWNNKLNSYSYKTDCFIFNIFERFKKYY